MYVHTQPRRQVRRRLGQIVSPGWVNADPSISGQESTPGDTSGCWWDYLTGGDVAYKACLNAAGVAQIQSVVTNAQKAGYPQSVIDVAQQTATQQEAQVPLDTNNIVRYYNLPSNVFIPSAGPGASVGDPSTWPWWVWALIAGGVGYVIVK